MLDSPGRPKCSAEQTLDRAAIATSFGSKRHFHRVGVVTVRNRVVFSIIGGLIVLVAGTAGWLSTRPALNEASSVNATSAVLVSVAAVQEKELSRITRLSGTVSPFADVTAIARVGGAVEWIVGDIGTVVESGDALVRLDDHDLKLQLRQAEAVLAQAEASLERMHKGASDEEHKQAEASVAQAEAGFRLAQESFQRAEFLYKEGVIARDALDAAQSQYTMARSQLDAAEQVMAQVKRGARPEELRAAEAQVAQAEVAVELARKQLSDAVVKAPIGGRVAMRHTQVGSMLGPGGPVMTIVDIDEVMVQVGVNDRLVNALYPGASVNVQIQALPHHTFIGEVVAVSPVADPQTRHYPVRIIVANPDHLVKPGMVATIDLELERTPPVPIVPQSAIVYKQGGAFIYVVDADGRVSERSVSPGLTSGDWVQVDRAEPGERVATSRLSFLSNGVQVSVEREAP